ncbi:hypothetical protein Y032_0426g1262 [Ancylostoma ceylanicum]|uniref:Uncharacterized protein n=1 Tax=Ancylostoma ceylanicum TaxID=53326 RepID=A0A016X0W4_9BILA|nr:hypothetical protein Y032_0426g1262 [Ancylostoma ceylanicum]
MIFFLVAKVKVTSEQGGGVYKVEIEDEIRAPFIGQRTTYHCARGDTVRMPKECKLKVQESYLLIDDGDIVKKYKQLKTGEKQFLEVVRIRSG